jgi:hypothetical protein
MISDAGGVRCGDVRSGGLHRRAQGPRGPVIELRDERLRAVVRLRDPVDGVFSIRRRDRADQHSFGDTSCSVAPDVTSHFAAARGMTDVDRILQIQLLNELGEVFGVGVEVARWRLDIDTEPEFMTVRRRTDC